MYNYTYMKRATKQSYKDSLLVFNHSDLYSLIKKLAANKLQEQHLLEQQQQQQLKDHNDCLSQLIEQE